MKKKLVSALALGIVMSGLLLFVYVAYLLFYPQVPGKFINDPFPVECDTVVQGQSLRYYVEYEKYIDMPVVIQVTLVNHVVINYPNIYMHLPTDVVHRKYNEVFIPEYITPGDAYLQIIAVYNINPLRNEILTARTQKFYIKEKSFTN